MDFYDRVKELCKQKDVPLLQFLEGIGVNYGSFKSCRKYGNLPRADEAYKIASALGVSVDYLVSGRTLSGSDDGIYRAKYESLVKDIKDFAGKIG